MQTQKLAERRVLRAVAIAVPTLLAVETVVACLWNSTSVTGAGGGRTGSTHTDPSGLGSTTASYVGSVTYIQALSFGSPTCGQTFLLHDTIPGNFTSRTTTSGEVNCGCWNWVQSKVIANGGTCMAEID